MLTLYLFLGEKDSLKEPIFDMLPFINEKQILFNKLILKKYAKNDLLINFPEVIELEQEIPHFLMLAQICQIKQFFIFLKSESTIMTKIKKIQEKIKDLTYQVGDILTFIVNNSEQNSIDSTNKIYYFQDSNSIEKKTVLSWLKKTNFSVQNRDVKSQQYYLSEIISNASQNFFDIINNQNDPKDVILANILQNNKLFDQMRIQVDHKRSIKKEETQYYCELFLLALLSCKEYVPYNKEPQNYSNMMINIRYCSSCEIIYEKRSFSWYYNSIYLYKIAQFEVTNEDLFACIQCRRQFYQCFINPILQKLLHIYLIKLVNKYFQLYFPSIQNEIISEDQSAQINKQQKDLAVMLFSSENQQKSVIFEKVYKKTNYKEQGEFNTGDTLLNTFYLIDSPLFSLDQYQEQQEAKFSQFLRKGSIHFIFFCINHQRTSLMKTNVLDMLKVFPNVNKDQMGIIISNLDNADFESQQDQQQLQEQHQEIKQSMQGILKKVIIITNKDDRNDIINKIQNCIQEIQITSVLSFKDTIFNNEDDEEVQNNIQKQLRQLTNQVENSYKQQQEKDNLYYQTKQQQLFEKQREFEKQQNLLQNNHYKKQNEYQEIINKFKNKMKEEDEQYNQEAYMLQKELSSIKTQINELWNQKYERNQTNWKY